jgi:hypothetical protein
VREAPRARTRQVKVGNVAIGGGAPVAVQSMTTTMTWDIEATLEQIRRLDEAGCEIVRVAVPDEKSADALPELVKRSPLPVVADIHFTWKLGLKAIAAGVHKVRINPGNIGGESRVREIVAAAKDRGIPIRVGANAGSLPKEIIAKYGVHDPAGHRRGGADPDRHPREGRLRGHRGLDEGLGRLARRRQLPAGVEAHPVSAPHRHHRGGLGAARLDQVGGRARACCSRRGSATPCACR